MACVCIIAVTCTSHMARCVTFAVARIRVRGLPWPTDIQADKRNGMTIRLTLCERDAISPVRKSNSSNVQDVFYTSSSHSAPIGTPLTVKVAVKWDLTAIHNLDALSSSVSFVLLAIFLTSLGSGKVGNQGPWWTSEVHGIRCSYTPPTANVVMSSHTVQSVYCETDTDNESNFLGLYIAASTITSHFAASDDLLIV